jgi:hypothetical protein
MDVFRRKRQLLDDQRLCFVQRRERKIPAKMLDLL